jgi:diguanylate cyclase (GGDEF)-like protein
LSKRLKGLSLEYLLDWNACEKATMQSVLTIPLFGFFMFWVWATWHFTDFGQTYFRQEGVRLNLLVGSIGVVGWFILSAVGLWLRARKRNSSRFVTVMVLYYGISLVPLAYTIGIFTPLTGIVLVGAPLVGFIMFGFRDVMWSFGLNLLGLAILSTLTSLGIIPYAPLFSFEMGLAYNSEPYWMLSQLACVVPFIVTAFGITYSLLTRWHAREAEALKMSLTDYLTGASNRRAVLDVIEGELTSVRKDSRPFVVAILDLDHFKQINDSHGHEVGDRVLVAVVRCLEEALRDTDSVGRYGGEEFVLVLPGTDGPTAIQVIERVRKAMSELRFDVGEDTEIGVSASFGLYVVEGEPGSPQPSMEDLLMWADEALYEAKACGRDCFRIWQPDSGNAGGEDVQTQKTPRSGGVSC